MTSKGLKVITDCSSKEGQEKAKKLASKFIGDGESPNKFFVTTGPYVRLETNGEFGEDYRIIEGFTTWDSETFGPFSNYDDALEFYTGIELDADFGVGQVFIEDRQVGTIREKFLKEKIAVTYVEDEVNDERLMKDF